MLTNLEILNIITNINNNSDIEKPIHYYLNGGCYIFAKKLQNLVSGDILYLTTEHHFIVKYNKRLYDASGNVTNKYKYSKCITELEFNQREKLVKSIKS
ncbi:MAG: hypothetical protein J6A59_12540 [Lachnospiraceae bacterium]|nr:hypothetical protein [Lachnospiraceae bacterium]